MIRLEQLTPTTLVKGILPDAHVEIVRVEWHGSDALTLVYRGPNGRVANEILYRHDELRLEIVESGRAWSFDGDGALFRLVSEAHRIRLAHLFDPVLAVHTSLVDPLPHQIMAVYEAIHSLREKGDRSPMILPSMIPIDDPRVQFELTRYLSDNWVPIIEKDVDGPNSLPLRIDGEQPNLGKVSAARRVARTIYMGSAPGAGVAHRGIEDWHVKLGCVMPGESAAVFGAESYDETAKRYRGLRAGQTVTVTAESTGLLVKPEVARRQMEAELKAAPPGPGPLPPKPETKLKRFHGTANLDPTRAGRDASRIADEVLARLVSQTGAEVTVTIAIEADLPEGASDQLVRTVTENSRTLKFTSHGFEAE